MNVGPDDATVSAFIDVVLTGVVSKLPCGLCRAVPRISWRVIDGRFFFVCADCAVKYPTLHELAAKISCALCAGPMKACGFNQAYCPPCWSGGFPEGMVTL
jgi:hypothetical protein